LLFLKHYSGDPDLEARILKHAFTKLWNISATDLDCVVGINLAEFAATSPEEIEGAYEFEVETFLAVNRFSTPTEGLISWDPNSLQEFALKNKERLLTGTMTFFDR